MSDLQLWVILYIVLFVILLQTFEVRFLVIQLRRSLMGFADDVKAKVAEVMAPLEGVAEKLSLAVADIQGLHAKLEALLNVGDVAGALAALEDAKVRAGQIAEAAIALQNVVDLPE